jgi:thymidine phosphorylase
MYAIIDDIAKNKLSDTMITYYVSSSYFYKTTDEELYLTAKAMAETGKTIKFPGVVVDKHCIGGVPGNETTMIVVPIITSLGYTMPKTFSKAITSPAATGECVELLMNISFTENQIKNIVKKK